MQESMKMQLAEQNVRQKYGKLPLHFIENKGKIDPYIRYYVQGKGFCYAFTSDSALLTFYELIPSRDMDYQSIICSGNPHFLKEQAMKHRVKGVTLDMRFLHANPKATLVGRQIQSGKLNFFRGNDPEKWVTNVPIYSEVVYRDLWEGIDLVFYEKDGRLKYDFILQPGANVGDIQLCYEGCESADLDEEGNLCLLTPFGVFRDEKPVSYQEIDGEYRTIESRFVVSQGSVDTNQFGFDITEGYNPHCPLIIDPGLVYSTYLGDSSTDQAFGIVVDAFGSAYVAGRTISTNFPVTPGAFDTFLKGNFDVFVSKLDSAGHALIYSTYLGGSAFDQGFDIAIDPLGNAYVTGSTNSSDYPTTPGAFETIFNGNEDAFVTKLNATGSALVFSTYLGGSDNDVGNGITIDHYGNVYVTGSTASIDFPATPKAFDPSWNGDIDAFVTKLDTTGSALIYSTFLGGSSTDIGLGIVVNDYGDAFVTGFTSSDNFPATPDAFDPFFNGNEDAFVTKLNATGSALIYSTYLGGSGADFGNGITIDHFGNAYVTGQTRSSNFPATPGAFDTSLDGIADAFVTKLDAEGSTLIYSTFLGGSGFDRGNSIAIDSFGNAYVTGQTDSTDFPVTPEAFDSTFNSVFDVFVSKIDATGSALVYSTYLGGNGDDQGFALAIDDFGKVYVTGFTSSTTFPTTPDAFDRNPNFFDAFVAKISM